MIAQQGEIAGVVDRKSHQARGLGKSVVLAICGPVHDLVDFNFLKIDWNPTFLQAEKVVNRFDFINTHRHH